MEREERIERLEQAMDSAAELSESNTRELLAMLIALSAEVDRLRRFLGLPTLDEAVPVVSLGGAAVRYVIYREPQGLEL